MESLIEDRRKEKKEKKEKEVEESSSEDEGEAGLRASHGADALNAFHILLRKHPERIQRIIRRRLSEALGVEPAAGRFRRYFMELGAFEGHKTLSLICWLLAGPVDELISGNVARASAQLMLVLLA